MTRQASTRRRRQPTAHQARCWLAWRACVAQARDLRVVVTTSDPRSPRNGTTGRIVMQTIDHEPRWSREDGGSTVALHFEGGARIPLEQIQTLERASD